jgi:hypothetical protein
METPRVGRRYKHPNGAILRITEIDEGKVAAWPYPADLRYVVVEGKNLGRYGVTTLGDACTWILLEELLAHWDGIRWTAVNEKMAEDLHVSMRLARVSGYGELNPSITLLVPRDQQRIVEEHHRHWWRAKGLNP